MRKTLEERYWEKVDRRGEKECWEWTGARVGGSEGQYGFFRGEHSKRTTAHRQGYMLAYGDIPTGMEVCHRCDNPICCNPSHLFLGTHTDNMQDKVAKGRARTGSYKLNDQQVWEVLRLRFDHGVLLQQIATKFGLTRMGIGKICQGINHADVYEEFMSVRTPKAA